VNTLSWTVDPDPVLRISNVKPVEEVTPVQAPTPKHTPVTPRVSEDATRPPPASSGRPRENVLLISKEVEVMTADLGGVVTS